LKGNKSVDPIITLLTDFGESDPYTGAMKGVILSICPKARIIDLSHNIQKHNIREGALYLRSVAKYFPKNTIHLVVVDPGVGSSRKPLIIQSRNYFFVGPDNGVLSLAALEDGVPKIVEISNTAYFLKPVSSTFHGRDIFAPIAAHLAVNRSIEKFGSEIGKWVQLEIPKVKIDGNKIYGEIIHIDRFGNVITNIPQEIFQRLQKSAIKFIQIQINQFDSKIKLCTSYDQGGLGEILVIFGSSNLLEIAKNQDSAAAALNVQLNDKILVELVGN
jgi:S-adenosylmethionine hydrolase